MEQLHPEKKIVLRTWTEQLYQLKKRLFSYFAPSLPLFISLFHPDPCKWFGRSPAPALALHQPSERAHRFCNPCLCAGPPPPGKKKKQPEPDSRTDLKIFPKIKPRTGPLHCKKMSASYSQGWDNPRTQKKKKTAREWTQRPHQREHGTNLIN